MTNRNHVFISAILGNVLEYYDFTVYAVFSIAIAKCFFPSGYEFTQILSSLGVFALGFITRPIGGIIFGNIADRYGRKTSLIISMLGMTIPTLVIAFIPSYESIGYAAPLILVLMRLMQGLCISGEGAGAAIFILEHHQNLRPGFTAGLVHASNIAGTLVATFVGIILAYFYPENSYLWRIAFFLGGVMGIFGFLLRLKVDETPIFASLEARKKTLRAPFKEVLHTSKRAMLITFTLGACASSIVYLIKTYINIYYCNILGLSESVARSYLAYSSIIMMVTMPISGHLSDIFGKFNMVRIAATLIVVLAFPCFVMMENVDTYNNIIALTILAVLGGLISGSSYVFIISLFAPSQRFSGVAFSYNLGIALCGGTSAFISCYLVNISGKYYTPSLYIIATALIFLSIVSHSKNWIKNTIEKNFNNQI